MTLKLANVRLAELETLKVLRFRYFIEALTISSWYFGLLFCYNFGQYHISGCHSVTNLDSV